MSKTERCGMCRELFDAEPTPELLGICHCCYEKIMEWLNRRGWAVVDAAPHPGLGGALRERIAKALWDAEIAESFRKKAFPERKVGDYAQWPADSLTQPYCQSTYRMADVVLAALSLFSPIEPPQITAEQSERLERVRKQTRAASEAKLGSVLIALDLLELLLERPTPQARERKNGESNLPWLQRVKLDGYIACGQHGDRYGEDSQVWDLTCERCSQRFDAIVRALDALAPSRQGAGGAGVEERR